MKTGTSGLMYRWKCSGIKRCQYLDSSIRNVSHTYVTPEDLQEMSRLQERYSSASDPSPHKRNATKHVYPTYMSDVSQRLMIYLENTSLLTSVLQKGLLVYNRHLSAKQFLVDSVTHLMCMEHVTGLLSVDYIRTYTLPTTSSRPSAQPIRSTSNFSRCISTALFKLRLLVIGLNQRQLGQKTAVCIQHI
jgi:hypothetical protein